MVHIVGLSIETTAPTDSAITPIMVREINIGEIPLGLRLGSDTTLLDAARGWVTPAASFRAFPDRL